MYGKDVWVNAKAMRAQGMSFVEIGSALGMDRRTAKKLCVMELLRFCLMLIFL